jgi:hypothetical protein
MMAYDGVTAIAPDLPQLLGMRAMTSYVGYWRRGGQHRVIRFPIDQSSDLLTGSPTALPPNSMFPIEVQVLFSDQIVSCGS